MRGTITTFFKFFLIPFYLLQYWLLWTRIPLDKDEWCFVCDGHLGDDYRLLVFLGEFSKRMVTKKLSVVISKQYSSLPKMFPYISKIISLKKIPNAFITGFVSSYTEALPGRPLLIHLKRPILYQTIPKDKFIENNALDTYKSTLGLEQSVKPAKPTTGNESKKRAYAKFNMLGLKVGKTVVVFPNANTHKIENNIFWKKILDTLKTRGFVIVGNSKPKEKIFLDINRVNLEIDELLPFVELAGYMISVRNGICDLLSSANATKFILYPDIKSYRFDTIVAYNYKNSGKTIELVLNSHNGNMISGKIIDEVTHQQRLNKNLNDISMS